MYCLKRATVVYVIFFLGLVQTTIAQEDHNIFSGFEEKKNKAIADLKKYTKPDTARVNALARLFRIAVFLKEQQQVKPYCDEAMVTSRRLNYTRGMAQCPLFTASFYRSTGNIPAAQVYYDSVIEISHGTTDSTILERRAQAFRWKGMIYYEAEDYYEALPNFFEALKYYDYDIGRVTVYMYSDISGIYLKLNNLEQAEFYAVKNVVLTEKSFPKMYQAEAYLSLVDIYIQKNDLDLALTYLNKMKSFMPDKDETMIDYGYYTDHGRISYLLQQYDSSFSYYQQAYKYAVLSEHDINVAAALYYLSGTALKLGKRVAARKYAEENLALSKKIDSKISKINALLNLSDYYHETGNQSKAYSFLYEATNLKDSLLSETNIKQANTLAAIYQAGKKQKEILRLQSEKEIQAGAIQQNSRLNKVFISTIIGLLVFGYLAYRTVKNEQKITNQKQEIQKQKIIELEKDRQLLSVNAMLKGQEEERSRLAKDLHDGLGGMLSGVKLSFINMKENMVLPAENLEGFERSISMLDNTIAELRKVAHNLMPETLVRFGLDEALKDFCNSIQTSTGIEVVYQQFGEDRKLSSQAEITIYRIIQELVNNALKYSEGKQILVQLTKNHIRTNITVEDNGKGFDVNILDQKKGAGFSNIRSRVNYFKGTLDINSQPGNGTSVNIELIA
jgi:two-component system, NarL family, sensor kinase